MHAIVVFVRVSRPVDADLVSVAEESGLAAVLALELAPSRSEVAGVVYGLVLLGSGSRELPGWLRLPDLGKVTGAGLAGRRPIPVGT